MIWKVFGVNWSPKLITKDPIMNFDQLKRKKRMLLSSENLIIEKEDLLGKVVFLFGSTKERKS